MSTPQSPEQSRRWYLWLLERSFANGKFYTQLGMLLHNDPYFMPAYLEMVWAAEERGDKESIRKLCLSALGTLKKQAQQTPRFACANSWSDIEFSATIELLSYITESPRFTTQEKLLARVLRFWCGRLTPKVVSSPVEPRHLLKVATYNPQVWEKELASLPYFWWQIDNTRAQQVIHHQHTHSILLRSRVQNTEAYIPHVGPHESAPTPYVNILQSVHSLVLGFANEERLALGRVAVVKLKPKQQAYRHFDSEPFLRGRKRYHLVLKSATTGNILSSGIDTAAVQPGELWFFDNSVMHRAHNKSNTERIHVIFDGYPLPDENE